MKLRNLLIIGMIASSCLYARAVSVWLDGQEQVSASSSGGGGDVYTTNANTFTVQQTIFNTNASAPLFSIYGKDSTYMMVLSNSFTAGSSAGLQITVDGANGPALEIRRAGVLQYQMLAGVGGLAMYSNRITDVGFIIPAVSNAFDVGTNTRPLRRIYAANVVGQGSVIQPQYLGAYTNVDTTTVVPFQQGDWYIDTGSNYPIYSMDGTTNGWK